MQRHANSHLSYACVPALQRLRHRPWASHITASLASKCTPNDVDRVTDLLFRIVETRRITVENDICIIVRTLFDSHDPSKTIILLKNISDPATEHQPFIRAIQMSTFARMMLGMDPFKEQCSTRHPPAAEAKPVDPKKAVGKISEPPSPR